MTITWFIIKTSFDTQVWLYNGIENKSIIFLTGDIDSIVWYKRSNALISLIINRKLTIFLYETQEDTDMTTILIRNDFLWLGFWDALS